MSPWTRGSMALLACCLAAPLQAQYRIDWHTIDGGGGASGGGTYTLVGTVGQADADIVPMCSSDGGPACINPIYQVEGGFWTAFARTECTGLLNCLFRDGFEAPAD